jgi:hypothetical protein
MNMGFERVAIKSALNAIGANIDGFILRSHKTARDPRRIASSTYSPASSYRRKNVQIVDSNNLKSEKLTDKAPRSPRKEGRGFEPFLQSWRLVGWQVFTEPGGLWIMRARF